jgi:alkylation response protein AidB-like acyl-CoA dehydrogenase
MTVETTADFGEQIPAMRDMVRSLAEKMIAPHAGATDATEEFPWPVVEAYREAGLLSLLVPEKYGGAGATVVHETAIAEELARVDVSAAIIFTSHSLCTEIVNYMATDEQKRCYLPRAVSGQLIAIALTESGAGSDAAGIQTSAKRTANGYILNGTKQYCTNGDVASLILVFAVTSPGKRARGISVFAVERSNPGFRITRHEKKMGLHGTTTVEFVLEDCIVPENARLGPENEGFYGAMFALERGRVAIAGVGVGLAQGAMEQAIGYAGERKQFGQVIGAFQGVQFMLADMAMEIEAARRLVYHAAQLGLGNSDSFHLASAQAKCFATDVAMRVTTNAVQVFGGLGYMRGCSVERMMRDAKILQIFDGTNQIMRVLIARQLMGRF